MDAFDEAQLVNVGNRKSDLFEKIEIMLRNIPKLRLTYLSAQGAITRSA